MGDIQEKTDAAPLVLAGAKLTCVFMPLELLVANYVIGDDYEYPFRNVAEIFAADDFTMGNFKGALTDSNAHSAKTYNFKAGSKYVKTLSLGGFDAVNLANDHNQLVMDLMKRIARKHNFVVLLHEKPFNGVNGSGKSTVTKGFNIIGEYILLPHSLGGVYATYWESMYPDEIKGVINNSFLLGSQQSYAKDISDILDTDAARSV
mgnify:CR=1 FL=1